MEISSMITFTKQLMTFEAFHCVRLCMKVKEVLDTASACTQGAYNLVNTHTHINS